MPYLWPAYFLCLYLASQPGPAAYFFAVTGPAVGFLALALTLAHLTRKGRAPHA
ncbi:hypothetical protein QOL99_02995 [Deinococcus sp. MIMF12]|uniref:Uncharacterized protein n=1 Tax=Deinococcus rhizophilus TaxID=3049544 RepID=A0ABT7JEW4_9DEIO|nr:hypothetical protein [Deinococcus rhizophilus]MDL2343112.1 hypothetical protein [Deinococcus rhizophilus]